MVIFGGACLILWGASQGCCEECTDMCTALLSENGPEVQVDVVT